MSRDEITAQSEQEWRRPSTFRLTIRTWGIVAECLKCYGRGQVQWGFVGYVRFMPQFRFTCECGNVAEYSIYNRVAGFPAEAVL